MGINIEAKNKTGLEGRKKFALKNFFEKRVRFEKEKRRGERGRNQDTQKIHENDQYQNWMLFRSNQTMEWHGLVVSG